MQGAADPAGSAGSAGSAEDRVITGLLRAEALRKFAEALRMLSGELG